MGKLSRYILIIIPLLVSACASQAIQAEQPPAKSLSYMDLLGKPLNDEKVVNLLKTNNCTNADQFQLCKDTGIALWLSPGQKVEQIYLYLNNVDGFASYQGELPLGLKFYDTMGAVEYKLRRLEATGNSSGGKSRMNFEGRSPDRMHYWVDYEPHGFTVIYNSPFADEDATIYAILLHG